MSEKEIHYTNALLWWFDYPCEHQKSVASFYGHGITFMCLDCNRQMFASLNYNTKTFNMTIRENDNEYGMVSSGDIADFIKHDINALAIPNPPGDPTGISPKEDAERFYQTIEVLKQNDCDVLSFKKTFKVDSTGAITTCSCCGHEESHNHE